jgi:hypothetical protein
MIEVTRVPESQRLQFLPMYFGSALMMKGEQTVYGWMTMLVASYNGAYWHYYRLNNGGFYMAPDIDGPLRLCVDGNGFDEEVSADAAGVIAMLFSLGMLASAWADKPTGERMATAYHLLRDFALEHAESALIMRAID